MGIGFGAGARCPGSGFLGLIALLGLAFAPGCSEEQASRPEDTPANIVVALYQSPEAFTETTGRIEIDGERIDREWGSEFTPERAFTQLRMSGEQGFGNPGTPRYISMKAVYTDEHLYLLLQWNDQTGSAIKDAFRYIGPTLSEPIVTCTQVGGTTVCDSLFRRGPQDSLLTTAWWEQFGDDDKLALAFEVVHSSGVDGQAFAEAGCQAACHAGSALPFGPLGSGRLDLWYWLAGRTNPVRNIFRMQDTPAEPTQGLPGYLDDWYSDRVAGLLPDEGWPCYLPNHDPGAHIPKYVYRRKDDRFSDPPGLCENRFGGECIVNNAVPLTYLWRELPTVFYPSMSPRDTLNETTQLPLRKWVTGDIVPGYLLTYPAASRADVRGKATFDEDNGVWTLEVARRLRTADPEHDVAFDPASGASYAFTIAIFDASSREHWGSEPAILRFGEKQSRSR